jgi:type I restriction enzyme S subunit
MGSEWRWRTLGELTDNFDSIRVPVKGLDRRPGPYPYYGASGVVDHVDRYLYDGEYLLIAEDGENLKTRTTPVAFLARGRFWVNNHAHVVRGNGQADTRFLMYALAAADINGYLSGSAMPKLTQASLNRIPLFVPELAEQRRIASILGALDDKIELNRRMSQTLESMARALFKSWFVDFDPVRAKAEGRDTGLPQRIADLFPSSLFNSELGEIPDGWEIQSLGDSVDLVKGRSYTSEELTESDTALVTLKSFARGGGYRPDGLKSFSGSYKAAQVVTPGELVVACTDVTQAAEVIGRPAIVRGTGEYTRLVASLDTMIVRPRGANLTRGFLYFLGGTDAFVAHTYAHTTGTTVLHLAAAAIPSFTFACPPAALVRCLDSVAAPALDRIQSLEEQSDAVAALRDSLLPLLIRGQRPILPRQGRELDHRPQAFVRRTPPSQVGI